MPTIDLGELATRLEAAGITGVEELSGGASSLTYVAHRHGRKVVVKVAPPGLPPVLHRDVLRQARLVRALARSDVPVPEVLWEDVGARPEVPPLFVMSFVEGSSVEPLFDLEGEPVEPEQMSARLRHAARALAALHRVEPRRLGLDGRSHRSARRDRALEPPPRDGRPRTGPGLARGPRSPGGDGTAGPGAGRGAR